MRFLRLYCDNDMFLFIVNRYIISNKKVVQMNISYDALTIECVDIFCKIGCCKEVAQKTVDALLLSEACGVLSHGVRMLPAHAKKIKKCEYNIDAVIEKEIETPSFARFNSHNQIGMVSATDCMQFAIDKALQNGIYTVFANNCNTFSAAFVYALQAARQGMIGFTMSNSPAQMAPIGGREKLLGTNPMSYAIPAKRNNPIIFDMATSVVAKSKINQAKEKGEKIPEGWALDIYGNPTTDPNEAVKGLVLPMAGAKGYGLTMMIDLIAGLLSNAQYLDGVGRFYNNSGQGMNVGQCFIAINPKMVLDSSFYEKVDDYIDRIHNSDKIENETISVPGDRKFKNLNYCKQFGFDVSDALWNDFNKVINE